MFLCSEMCGSVSTPVVIAFYSFILGGAIALSQMRCCRKFLKYGNAYVGIDSDQSDRSDSENSEHSEHSEQSDCQDDSERSDQSDRSDSECTDQTENVETENVKTTTAGPVSTSTVDDQITVIMKDIHKITESLQHTLVQFDPNPDQKAAIGDILKLTQSVLKGDCDLANVQEKLQASSRQLLNMGEERPINPGMALNFAKRLEEQVGKKD